jgi:hypothetical protein
MPLKCRMWSLLCLFQFCFHNRMRLTIGNGLKWLAIYIIFNMKRPKNPNLCMWSSPHLPGGPSHKEEVRHGEQIEMIGHMHHIQHSETKELLTGSWSSTLWCLLLGHHKKKTHRVLPKHILPKGLGSVGNHVTCVSQLVTIYEANKHVIPLSTWTEMLKFWLLWQWLLCKQYK